MASGKARASYGSKMKVYTGIELGQPTQNKLAADDVLSLCDYDFVIGSLHNLKMNRISIFLNIIMIMLMTCSRDISHSFMNLQ